MNYKNIYNSLVLRGQLRGLDKTKINYYTESHHVVPKSMGGSDDDSNLVLLTAREHFIAHLLLSKIHNSSKMHYALWMMCNYADKTFKVHSKFYERARMNHSKSVSKSLTGRTRTDEHRANLSNALKGRRSHTEGKFLGIETRKKISQSLTGKIQSEETKRKRSESQKGKSKALYPACPHCGIIASKATAIRWHYDNCKFNKGKK